MLNLTPEDVKGKRIIDIGSYNVNGSFRPIFESWKPAEYVGVDIAEGPGVDVVCTAEETLAKFGPESFDMVISTEMIEHTRNWRKVISNFKNLCKPGGVILVTTRSYGSHYHAYPNDFWRYEADDFKNIFSDLIINKIDTDPVDPGVVIKATKPAGFKEIDLSNYKLYSIVTGQKMIDIDDKTLEAFYSNFNRYDKVKDIFRNIYNFIFGEKKVI